MLAVIPIKTQTSRSNTSFGTLGNVNLSELSRAEKKIAKLITQSDEFLEASSKPYLNCDVLSSKGDVLSIKMKATNPNDERETLQELDLKTVTKKQLSSFLERMKLLSQGYWENLEAAQKVRDLEIRKTAFTD